MLKTEDAIKTELTRLKRIERYAPDIVTKTKVQSYIELIEFILCKRTKLVI